MQNAASRPRRRRRNRAARRRVIAQTMDGCSAPWLARRARAPADTMATRPCLISASRAKVRPPLLAGATAERSAVVPSTRRRTGRRRRRTIGDGMVGVLRSVGVTIGGRMVPVHAAVPRCILTSSSPQPALDVKITVYKVRHVKCLDETMHDAAVCRVPYLTHVPACYVLTDATPSASARRARLLESNVVHVCARTRFVDDSRALGAARAAGSLARYQALLRFVLRGGGADAPFLVVHDTVRTAAEDGGVDPALTAGFAAVDRFVRDRPAFGVLSLGSPARMRRETTRRQPPSRPPVSHARARLLTGGRRRPRHAVAPAGHDHRGRARVHGRARVPPRVAVRRRSVRSCTR